MITITWWLWWECHLLADVILLLSLFKKNSEGKPSCDFPNQKVWIYIWEVLNILAIVGLVVALGKIFYRKIKKWLFSQKGWYSWLGFWAMLHVPVHFVVFLILLLIIPLEIYLVFLIFVLSKYLKEAYIDVSFSKLNKTLNL